MCVFFRHRFSESQLVHCDHRAIVRIPQIWFSITITMLQGLQRELLQGKEAEHIGLSQSDARLEHSGMRRRVQHGQKLKMGDIPCFGSRGLFSKENKTRMSIQAPNAVFRH